MKYIFWDLVDDKWLHEVVNNPNEYLDATVDHCKNQIKKRKNDNTI